MEWLTILYKIFEVCIIPLLGLLTSYIIKYVNAKSLEVQAKTENDKADKYIAMLDHTICACVVATTQTYVEALKKEGNFTKEAQEKAFRMTYDAVINVLSDEAKAYLTEIYGDVVGYITARIEAEVKLNKTLPSQ